MSKSVANLFVKANFIFPSFTRTNARTKSIPESLHFRNAHEDIEHELNVEIRQVDRSRNYPVLEVLN